ncbi:MAG: thymidine phosphorylase [Clostridia bacterium]|nr:thymidine phosphorylase [Clostridia bacterium]
MRMYDIIEKKRDKKELSEEEIQFFINEYSNDKIPDYQASALLMAMYLNGLTNKELVFLTFAMANSAKKLDLSRLRKNGNVIVDKHSTGGVGDKVTLIVLPIVASLGVSVCKMSGKGLGYTGGTADKLESIVGYDINIPLDQAISQVEEIGVSLISQSGEIAIADKKLYALRDVTATVSSIPLIASSIMSKKIASGVDKILLDVTVGSGAFMQNIDSARELAKTMVEIGKLANVETKAVITSMEEPLGKSVGNALEIKEVISFLLSNESTLNSPENRELKEVVFEISAHMIKMAGLGDDIEANKLKIMDSVTSKKAYDKFIELVKAQGGHIHNVYMDWINMSLDMPILKDEARYLKEIHAESDGYIISIDSKKIGEALVALGGGRQTKEDQIDYSVGFEFIRKVGSKVKAGDTILNVIYNDKDKFNEAFEYINEAIYIDNVADTLGIALRNRPNVLDIIT